MREKLVCPNCGLEVEREVLACVYANNGCEHEEESEVTFIPDEKEERLLIEDLKAGILEEIEVCRKILKDLESNPKKANERIPFEPGIYEPTRYDYYSRILYELQSAYWMLEEESWFFLEVCAEFMRDESTIHVVVGNSVSEFGKEFGESFECSIRKQDIGEEKFEIFSWLKTVIEKRGGGVDGKRKEAKTIAY